MFDKYSWSNTVKRKPKTAIPKDRLAIQQERHLCNGAKPTEVLRAQSVRQRASGREGQEWLRVSSGMPRPHEHDHRTCGKERVRHEFPLRFKMLLIATQMGRD